MIGYIIAIILSFQLGYQVKKYMQMKEEKKMFDECDRISNDLTSHESIERDVNKKLMQKVLENKLRTEQYRKGVN
jgi:hypothetical protein